MSLLDLFFKPASVQKSVTSGKNPQAFDARKECELLKEYKKYKGKRNSDEYFAAMPMIDFYYKFRNLDEKYLNSSVHYCNICIACLDAKDMKDIVRKAHIPAFKKLVIIYENKGEYDTAREIAEKAIQYVHPDETEYYTKKIRSFLKKKFNG